MSVVQCCGGNAKGRVCFDVRRQAGKVGIQRPHFAGWEMYHLKGSPADPNRIYASQTSGWFGQIIQRSDDGRQDMDSAGNAA
jgi:hypothetical protein